MPSKTDSKTSTLNPTLLLPWLLVAVGVATFATSLGGTFVFDDRPHILLRPYVHQIGPVTQYLAMRGLVQFTLAVNYAIGGTDPVGYHLFNVVIHLAAALLLLAIIGRTLQTQPLRERFGQAAPWLAFTVALLWMVHPLQTQSVAYVIQRAEAMAGLFMLAMLYSVIRMSQSPRRSGLWLAAALLAFLLAMLSKEIAVTAPLLVLLYDRAFLGGSLWAALRQRWALYGPIVAAAAAGVAYLMVNVAFGSSTTVGFATEGVTPMQYLLTQPAVIVRYLGLSIWPHPLVLDYGWRPALHFHEHGPQAMALAAGIVLTLWALWRNRPIAMLGAWPLIILAPTSSFVPLADLYFEHRMYLPLAAVMAAVTLGGYMLVNAMLRRRAMDNAASASWVYGLLVVAAALPLAVRSAVRNLDYHDEVRIWESAARHRPGNPRIHMSLGEAVMREHQDVDRALAHYRMATYVDPLYADAYNNIGTIYSDLGQWEQAQRVYSAALRIKPRDSTLWRNLGRVAHHQRDWQLAEQHLRQSLALDANHPGTLEVLAMTLMEQQRFNEGADFLERALELHPQAPQLWNNLGILRQRQGRADLAEAAFERSLALTGDPGVARWLAWMLATHPTESMRQPRRALELADYANRTTGDRLPLFLDTLAAALASAGQFDHAVQVQRRALAILTAAGAPEDAVQPQRQRLALYENRRPYVER